VKVHSSELTLGSVVDLGLESYRHATVKNIKPNGDIELFRPFVATADFSYTGGVICYVGIEEFASPPGEFELVREGPKLK